MEVENRTVAPFLDESGKIKNWPSKWEKQKAVTGYLAEKFEYGRDYTEKEVNTLCGAWHTFGDYFILRRSLVDFGFLRREKDGSRYWRREGDAGSLHIPITLKHKPVYAVEDYEGVDGRCANHTDAKGLSLGLAQWNERGRVDVSAKVWRYTGEKWSRQSEELPLHRVLDLCLLILSAKKHMSESYRYPKLYDPESPILERIPVQGDAMTARICTNNPYIDEDIRLFTQVMAEDDELLSERLHRLSDMLRELGYGCRKKDGDANG